MCVRCGSCSGTTSACAENTCGNFLHWSGRWNYLRVRGEYPVDAPTAPVWVELPPRARRILCRKYRGVPAQGTTSACAENTDTTRDSRFLRRNYLRVRGEYITKPFIGNCVMELPPRARRIPIQKFKRYCVGGTTSACAENTSRWYIGYMASRNYLRVRGEYTG